MNYLGNPESVVRINYALNFKTTPDFKIHYKALTWTRFSS